MRLLTVLATAFALAAPIHAVAHTDNFGNQLHPSSSLNVRGEHGDPAGVFSRAVTKAKPAPIAKGKGKKGTLPKAPATYKKSAAWFKVHPPKNGAKDVVVRDIRETREGMVLFLDIYHNLN